MKIREYFLNTLAGFFIGIFMLVPGVSGGTIAILIGIYDRLLDAVSSLFWNFKSSIKLLLGVGFGGIIGFASMAGVLTFLLQRAKLPTVYFFIGIIVAGIFILIFDWRKRGVDVFMIFLGCGIVGLLHCLPFDVFIYNDMSVASKFMVIILAGLLLGAALILPGISFSVTLMSLGLYEKFLQAIQTLDVYFLLPIAFSTLFGVILLAKLLANFMRKYSKRCYGLILGFVIASLAEIFPGYPKGEEIIWCIIAALCGCAISVVISFATKRKRA